MTIRLTVQAREETKADGGHTACKEHVCPQEGGQFQLNLEATDVQNRTVNTP